MSKNTNNSKRSSKRPVVRKVNFLDSLKENITPPQTGKSKAVKTDISDTSLSSSGLEFFTPTTSTVNMDPNQRNHILKDIPQDTKEEWDKLVAQNPTNPMAPKNPYEVYDDDKLEAHMKMMEARNPGFLKRPPMTLESVGITEMPNTVMYPYMSAEQMEQNANQYDPMSAEAISIRESIDMERQYNPDTQNDEDYSDVNLEETVNPTLAEIPNNDENNESRPTPSLPLLIDAPPSDSPDEEQLMNKVIKSVNHQRAQESLRAWAESLNVPIHELPTPDVSYHSELANEVTPDVMNWITSPPPCDDEDDTNDSVTPDSKKIFRDDILLGLKQPVSDVIDDKSESAENTLNNEPVVVEDEKAISFIAEEDEEILLYSDEEPISRNELKRYADLLLTSSVRVNELFALVAQITGSYASMQKTLERYEGELKLARQAMTEVSDKISILELTVSDLGDSVKTTKNGMTSVLTSCDSSHKRLELQSSKFVANSELMNRQMEELKIIVSDYQGILSSQSKNVAPASVPTKEIIEEIKTQEDPVKLTEEAKENIRMNTVIPPDLLKWIKSPEIQSCWNQLKIMMPEEASTFMLAALISKKISLKWDIAYPQVDGSPRVKTWEEEGKPDLSTFVVTRCKIMHRNWDAKMTNVNSKNLLIINPPSTSSVVPPLPKLPAIPGMKPTPAQMNAPVSTVANPMRKSSGFKLPSSIFDSE